MHHAFKRFVLPTFNSGYPSAVQAFCWLCGEGTGHAHTWSNINGHECGRWKEELDRKVDEAARNHKRYMHYFERFKTHADSYKKESLKRLAGET